ncbi:TonB-dependent receptor domain-containing protein [Emcibacter sp.]|uniref:TonB-dependent receptor domain-containing protein n=1 Tax=Emcibacter sp. TaxID=1979954 RepID=UPI002AA8B2FE|nr:TonB-dependent receptor [Emcibacter sp.]
MKSVFSTRLRYGVSALVLAGLHTIPLHQTANAQEAEEEMAFEEVVVTGTRIKRADLVANSPVSTINAESLKVTGTNNIEEFLRDIPQAVPALGSSSNNGNPGVSTVDLRNLGEERTLVLVDGKRFTPYDSNGYVDLNMIPTSLIKRVEVVTGGASAVYGSDAIAGVVNFILNDDFEGVEIDTQYGLSENGDAERFSVDATIGGGFGNDRGHAVVNFGYMNMNALTQDQRDFGVFALDDLLQEQGSFTKLEGVVDGALALVPGSEEYEATQFDPDGNLVPFEGFFNFNPYNLYQTPQKKITATALASYDINENMEAYARLSFANSRVNTVLAPSGTFFFPFQLNLDNPYLSSQAIGALSDVDGDGNVDAAFDSDNDGIIDADATTTIAFGRRLLEVGTRDSFYENTAYQVVSGLRGDFAESYNYDLFMQYGRTSRTTFNRNDVNFSKAQQAMLAVDDGEGNIVCQDPSGGCIPANFFGLGNLSAEAAAFIALDLATIDKTEQLVVGGTVGGDTPFQLPTADLPGAFVVGFEYRNDSGERLPDDNLQAGNSIGFGSDSLIDSDIKIWEGYFETQVPLVQDVAFAKSLTFEGALRYSDYTNTVTVKSGASSENSFTNWTYKAGGEWTPVDGIRIRGMYQRAVRAPNLNEIGLPNTPSTGDLTTDPCQGDLPVGNATLTAQCIAQGVPAANIGSVGGPISGQINNFIGGNVNLTPEKSNTFSIGAVFQPEAVPGLAVTIDYYSIKITNAVAQISEQNILDACISDGLFCDRIHRNPLNGRLIGGTETGVDVSLVNAAFQKTQGIDLAITYSFDLSGGEWGSIDLAFNGTHVIENLNQDAEILSIDDCAGVVGNVCLRPDPKWRWTQNVTWNYEDFSLFFRWQHLSSVEKDLVAFGDAPASDYALPKIPSVDYFDLSASYNVMENMTVRAGINNLFDKQPPIPGNDYGGTTENSGNTYPGTYDVIGRFFFFGATAKF